VEQHPGRELLVSPRANRLSKPAFSRRQVRHARRSRATALTKNFGGPMLYLRNLDIKDASTFEFPDFDDLRNSFRAETECY